MTTLVQPSGPRPVRLRSRGPVRSAAALLLGCLFALMTALPAQAFPWTAVSYVSTRTSTSVLAVNSPAAIYNAKTDSGSECLSSTYAVLYATWNVRQVSTSSVYLESVTLRLTNHRGIYMAGGFLSSGSSTITYRTLETYCPAGVRYITYPIRRTLSWNSYRQLRLQQNFSWPGTSEPYYCRANVSLSQWLQRR